MWAVAGLFFRGEELGAHQVSGLEERPFESNPYKPIRATIPLSKYKRPYCPRQCLPRHDKESTFWEPCGK